MIPALSLNRVSMIAFVNSVNGISDWSNVKTFSSHCASSSKPPLCGRVHVRNDRST